MSDSQDSEFYGIRALNAVDALGIAAVNSKLKEIGSLLADGVDINGVAIYSKETALSSAAAHGATRLIEKGADVNRPDGWNLTPLMHACAHGKKKGLQIAKQLIEAGADVNAVRAVDEMTALKFSIQGQNAELIQLLLEHGADPNGPPGTEQTALMLAARNNFVDALRVLIDGGADPTLTCKLPWAENRTAAGLAELEKRRQALAFFKSLEK